MGTYTANYNLFLPTVGEQGWGTLVNGNFTTIDATMKGLDARISPLEAVNPPIGTIMMYGGDTVPNDRWFICNGDALNRTTYAALFAIIGTTYGAGDGSTTYNLPNLQGRVPIGASDTYTLGSIGGEETHVLTISEMPAHTHTVPCGRNKGSATCCYDDGGVMMAHQSTTPATGSTGGNVAHNNMQPYITLNYIIRTQ